MIEHKYRDINFISQKKILDLIYKKDFDRALNLISEFTNNVILIPEFTGEVLYSNYLDNFLSTIGELNKIDCSKDGSLIFLSSLPAVGGHIMLLFDLIKNKALGNNIDIILTKENSIENIRLFRKGFNVQKIIVKIHNCKNKSYLSLLRKTKKIGKKNIFLFSDADDAKAISIACSLNSSKINFIHHSDNVLSLGASLKNFIHYDLSNMGYNHCLNNHNSKNRYLPLSAKPKKSKYYRDMTFDNKKIVSCTSGREEKFNFDGIYFYSDVILNLLSTHIQKHYHIGKLEKKYLNFINKQLIKNKIDPKRFIHVKKVKSISEFLYENSVDIYLSSFPIPGAKTNIEVIGSGVPIIIYESPRNSYFHAIDIMYKGIITWKDCHELVSILNSIDFKTLNKHSKEGIKHFNKYYDYDSIDIKNIFDNYKSIPMPKLANLNSNKDVLGKLLVYRKPYTKEIKKIYIEYSNVLNAYEKLVKLQDNYVYLFKKFLSSIKKRLINNLIKNSK
jgi:hypothetical protein